MVTETFTNKMKLRILVITIVALIGNEYNLFKWKNAAKLHTYVGFYFIPFNTIELVELEL